MARTRILYYDAPGPATEAVIGSLNLAGYAVEHLATADAFLARLESSSEQRAETLLVLDISEADDDARRVMAQAGSGAPGTEAPVVCFIHPKQSPPAGKDVIALKQPIAAPALLRMIDSIAGRSAPGAYAPARADEPRFGDYELIEEIASGGMGTVFLAQRRNQIGFHRLHALKVMHPHLVEDPEVSSMFLDEAALASRVHHGNVAAIVDLGVDDGRPYIVMQYIEGCSLSALMRANRGPAPPTLIASIMLDALDGLHAAHSLIDDDGSPLCLVHRDVSPENILVGIDGIARIADFGIAKARNRITTTQRGVRKGKLLYLTPEQLREDEELDGRVDVFAAGVVLWNALTGQRLFSADSPAGVMHNIMQAEIPAPSQVEASVPEAFDEICRRALRRERSERYDSAQAMALALRAATVDLGLSMSPSDVGGWVGSVCGEELEARRATARGRRRSWGPPTSSFPTLSSHSLSSSGMQIPTRTEISTRSLSFHSGTTGTEIVSEQIPADKAPTPGWRYVAAGAASVLAGGLIALQCASGRVSPSGSEAAVVRAARVTPAPATPNRRAATPQPRPEGPSETPQSAPASENRAGVAPPSPAPTEPPADAVPASSEPPRDGVDANPSDAVSNERPSPKSGRGGSGRRRRRPRSARAPASVSAAILPSAVEPAAGASPADVSPDPKPTKADPLRGGPEANPYK